MRVGKSVQKAIDEWQQGDQESAMLHACNSIDGTAKKLYPTAHNNERFTRLLRENYGILGPMAAPGINLVTTRFPVSVPKPKAPGGQPDFADVVYGIHRCCHGHGEELPAGFDLIPDASGPARWTRLLVERGRVQLSDRVIFGLIAVAVFSPANKDQRTHDGYYLTFGDSYKFIINEWWGRGNEFPEIVAKDPVPLVTLNFGNWM